MTESKAFKYLDNDRTFKIIAITKTKLYTYLCIAYLCVIPSVHMRREIVIYVIRYNISQHIVPHLHVVEILHVCTIHSIIPD